MSRSGKWIFAAGSALYLIVVVAALVSALTSNNKFGGIPVIVLTEPWSMITTSVVDALNLGWFDGDFGHVMIVATTLVEALLNVVLYFFIVWWATKTPRDSAALKLSPTRQRYARIGFIIVTVSWILPWLMGALVSEKPSAGLATMAAVALIVYSVCELAAIPGLILGFLGRHYLLGQIALIGSIIALLKILWMLVSGALIGLSLS